MGYVVKALTVMEVLRFKIHIGLLAFKEILNNPIDKKFQLYNRINLLAGLLASLRSDKLSI